MRILIFGISILLCLFSCKTTDINALAKADNNTDLVIAFGSCNKQNMENTLWDDVLENNPSYWIWGGDIIYSDTDDMSLMAEHYKQQLNQDGYSKIIENTNVHGTWDDHDYGLNDGGEEFAVKDESQQLLLDFLGVPEDHERRRRKGVYYAENISVSNGNVKLIVLDTRYFRAALTPSKDSNRRYDPNPYGEGSLLGKAQWEWLETELSNSKADFNLIVSSIQVLSYEHGYEKWGNMPHEVDKLYELIVKSNAKGVVVLSGDRHISEFSKTKFEGMSYPLIDFTSSGLTHSYSNFTNEPNANRIGKVVTSLSFGVLKFNFETKTITMEMRGDGNVLQQDLIQSY
ncbi:MAG: alkaline phosphatase family protein [Flavobacteriaceae bacterium]|nr:alkaline phosphatase family protein [Flavobacteriaceae bacterium]